MHIDDLSTSHYEPPRLRKLYLNAQHAADQWCALRDHILGIPAFDPTRPVVSGTNADPDAALVRVLDEKRELDRAFLAVGGYHNPGVKKWSIWVKVRLHGEPVRAFEVSKARVCQIRDDVDVFIDRELDRRGMLLGEQARRRARDLGWRSPNRR